jgi:cystathionine beta-lyase/cystathionine gamma-synthase
MRFSTKAIRVAQCPRFNTTAVVNPIVQSTTFLFDNLDEMPPHDYSRVSNPNRSNLEEVLAELESGNHCTVFSSGMAAITAVFALLKQGDHLLMASDIYGGTHRLVNTILPRQGITCTEFDANDPLSLDQAVQPNTKMVIFEAPTNPLMRVCDIEAIARKAKELGLISVFDNTFASPYLQRALELGVDIVVHSTTKYISGHSDVVGGAVICRDPDIHAFIFEYIKTTGACPSPFDCWLSLRGLKTLAVRMKAHCENALAIAKFLESHPMVERVNYPGLESHPDHEIAKHQMRGFSGMLSFEVRGGWAGTRAVCENTKIFQMAESLGGVESLIGAPRVMSHGAMTEDERLERGIRPSLIRVSVGIEDVEDLIEDLDQALACAAQVVQPAEARI